MPRRSRPGRSRVRYGIVASLHFDLQAQLDLLPLTVVRLDGRGLITHVNEAWRRFACANGGDAATIAGVGLPYLDAMRGVSVDGAPTIAAGLTAVLAGRQATFAGTYPCHSPTELRWFRLEAHALPAVDGVVLTHLDVTAHHLAEARGQVGAVVAQVLAERVPLEEACVAIVRAACEALVWEVGVTWTRDGAAGWRCAGTWTAADPACVAFAAAAETIALGRGDALVARAAAARAPAWSVTPAAELQPVRAALASRAGLRAGCAVPVTAGGEVVAVLELLGRVQRAPDAALLAQLARAGELLGDQVVRARDEQRVAVSQAEMLIAQRLAAVGTLAGGVAHEINTPIQFVSDSVCFVRDAVDDVLRLVDAQRAVTQLAARGDAALGAALEAVRAAEAAADLAYLREQVPEAIARALEGLGRISTIVRALKAFAQPRQVEMAPDDLNHAIVDTLTLARGEYAHVAELVTELGPLPPVTCHLGDVRDVVLSLVANAAEAIAAVVAAGAPRGTITVRTWRDGDAAVIAVADTGGGIPPAIAARVFELFFTTKDVGQGTGQGLASAWTVVVVQHGGTLRFESEVGRGTTFFVRLPIVGPPSAA